MKVRVDVFSTPGCATCDRARDALKSVADAFGQDQVAWREVNVLDELDYAVELGVVTTPCIAIDGELVFARLPGADKLREELAGRLARTVKP